MPINSISYQKSIVLHKTDVDKYFRIKNKFYRIFKVTKNHVHYAECYLDKELRVLINIRFEAKKMYLYQYYSSEFFTGNALYETKTTIQNKIYWNFNKLYDDISDLYLVSEYDEHHDCDAFDVAVKDNYQTSVFNTDTTNKLAIAGHLKSNLISLYRMALDDEPRLDRRLLLPIPQYITLAKLFLEKVDLEFVKSELCTELEKYQIDIIVEKYKLLKKQIDHHNKECPVCLDTKTVFEGYYDCKHLICADCEKSWGKINSTCPLCRSA
jgi:hypothetical protein